MAMLASNLDSLENSLGLWESNSGRLASNSVTLENTEDLMVILRKDWSGSNSDCWGSAAMATWGRTWGSWGSSSGSRPRVRVRGCRVT